MTPPALVQWVCATGQAEDARHPVWSRMLSVQEQVRASRFVRAEQADQYRTSHVGLRRWLGERLGVAPAALCFGQAGQSGKPVLLPCAGHFSFSHAGPAWAAALRPASSGPVGIDIECLDAFTAADPGFARLVLSPAERLAWRTLDAACAARALARVWTRKEAVLKAIGCGLRRAMSSLDVGWAGVPRTLAAPDLDGVPCTWRVQDLHGLAAGLVGALAWQVAEHSIAVAAARPFPAPANPGPRLPMECLAHDTL